MRCGSLVPRFAALSRGLEENDGAGRGHVERFGGGGHRDRDRGRSIPNLRTGPARLAPQHQRRRPAPIDIIVQHTALRAGHIKRLTGGQQRRDRLPVRQRAQRHAKMRAHRRAHHLAVERIDAGRPEQDLIDTGCGSRAQERPGVARVLHAVQNEGTARRRKAEPTPAWRPLPQCSGATPSR